MTRLAAMCVTSVLVLAGCAFAPSRAAPFAGGWEGEWKSEVAQGLAGSVGADLTDSGGRVGGHVEVQSVMGRFTLRLDPPARVPDAGPLRFEGMAVAADASSTVRVATTFERRGDEIQGTYEFPALQDRGTFTLRPRTPSR